MSNTSKVDVNYHNDKIIIRFNALSSNKSFSFNNIGRTESKELIDFINEKEELTWLDFSRLDRTKGFITEKKDSNSFNKIKEQDIGFSNYYKDENRYYFHCRVKSRDKQTFRIFGYQWKQYFYITHLDTEGDIHKKAHK